MPRKKHKKPVSQAQAKLYGAAAGGQIPGFSPKKARDKLRGVKISKLPKRSGRKK